MKYFIQKKQIKLSPQQIIGQGGEAEVYTLSSTEVVKLFKSPQHPSFTNDTNAQTAAKERILQHQQKLIQFPKGLPENVLALKDLVTDKSNKIVGYTMSYLKDAQPLYRYGDRRFREQNGISHQQITNLFIQLHKTLKTLHNKHIVVGDFNDLNILVQQKTPYFIDTDSWQFDTFLCKVFTPRFVDPILCDANLSYPDLSHTHNKESDWYAYSLLLFRCLLYVDLYGGIYPDKTIPQISRSLHRITVFNPKIKYPKPSLPYSILNDDLIQYFRDLSEKDKRGIFPVDLLTNLVWQTCSSCGQIHSQKSCPICKIQPIAITQPTFVGKQLIFQTKGTIITTQFTPTKTHYLYWEDGEFKRETGAVIFKGDRSPDLKFWIDGDHTYIGKNGTILCFVRSEFKSDLTLPVDQYKQQPCFFAQAGKRYWLHQGKLWGDRSLGRGFIGDVLENQSHFWVTNHLGFGLYQAGHWLSGFTFQPHRQGINDQSILPPLRGEIIETHCYIKQDIWLLISLQNAGQIEQHVIVLDSQGKRRSHQVFSPTTLPYLDGHCATEDGLYIATDAGLKLLTVNGDKLEFHDLKIPAVDFEAGLHLVQTPTALFFWDTHCIYRLPTLELCGN
ncbi:hypothetical protein Lepto7376_4095 [[Leptolyngbya] sp. PCC 7376]|uniref:hypothetical protein n=1 Tax=[Leptolyngbya] sp. PCC 7376 TaxID=111781 RepID=UPI00029F230A|nr:hypothetical protein [[Leptolyngbya] sp. PCC 7376]AFY40224.1 hypothetical protein Lepto7376_4095 [[Leptolyngbya] sp. PCC 7376]